MRVDPVVIENGACVLIEKDARELLPQGLPEKELDLFCGHFLEGGGGHYSCLFAFYDCEKTSRSAHRLGQ